MKRRFRDTRDTSLRPSTQGRLPMNDRPWFRFLSATSSAASSGRNAINFQPVISSAVAAFGNQFTPFSVGMNHRMARFRNALRIESNFPGPWRHAHKPNALPMATFPFIPNALPMAPFPIPRTALRFQEMQRNFAFQHQAQSARDSYKMQAKDSTVRKWDVLPEDRSSSPSDLKFSIVSYNLLSDKLLFKNKFLYEGCREDVLRWEFRKENLLNELLSYNADILCLQEVDADHYKDWFQPKLGEAGYIGVYNQRTGGKPDGCATFYKCLKFTLVKEKLIKYYTRNVPVLDKDNVGIVVLLKANMHEITQRSEKDKEPKMLCVANTHLLFNKKRGDIKLAQLTYLFAEVDNLAMLSRDRLNEVYCPVILCGDLNSIPYSPLHHFVTKGVLEYSTRAPAVISGQLLPSEFTNGPSKRIMGTPLLPWCFGVTSGCQWRNLGSATGQDEGTSVTSVNNSEVERAEHETTGIITLPFRFESVYKHRFEDGTPEVTTCHSKSCCNVDYIFYTLGMRDDKSKDDKKYQYKGKLTLLGKLQLLGKSDFNVVKQLPNQQFSSDHLSLLALFKLS